MHLKKEIVSLLIAIVVAAVAGWAHGAEPYVWTDSKFSYKPENGCVPDARTAIKIAEAVLTTIYGEKEVDWNKPFTAVLRKGIWRVGGWGNHPGIEGGGMEIDIARSDGRISRIWAGQ
jgi:hypothetical protein